VTVELSEREVRAASLAAFGEPAEPGSWQVEQVAYESGSPATGALLRVHGQATGGRSWSLFVKLLQHIRHWPLLHLVPEDVRDSFADWFPWRAELAAWDEPFAGRLPAGLRVPRLYHLTELGDDRVLVWMEDIDALEDAAWSADTFVRAARALGGLAALRGTPDLLAADAFSSTPGLLVYVDSRVNQSALPALADDDLWRHPLVAGAVDDRLRADLRRIAAALPAILDRLDTLPQALPHGDASPQNLLVPRDSPKQFVAIDIGFQGPHAVGFDLGQLLVGLAHAGVLTAGDLPAIHDSLVPSFVAGMAAYGVDVDPADVTYGYVGSLVARSALTSMPFEALGAPPTDELARRFRQRAELTRYLVDLGLALIDA
jgi:hypothetical protein